MDPDKLESTNQRLYDLERKLSLVLTSSLAYTTQSQGSVVQDPTHSGLARQNIQLSVLQYIKGHTSEFDADRVFSDRQRNFATTFGREYSPSQSNTALVDMPKTRHEPENTPRYDLPVREGGYDANPAFHVKQNVQDPQHIDDLSSNYASDDYADYFDDDDDEDFHEQEINGIDEIDEIEKFDDDDDDDDSLLPSLPPRLPPREMDPTKLYGLFDFLGPDPLHCTLHRDEPVYLLNDLDNYWWLIRKLNKAERQILWHKRGSHDDMNSEDEDGKIGFVPAECLETYGERLARLNCFKNEELERFSRDTLPPLDTESKVSVDHVVDAHHPKTSSVQHTLEFTLGRSSSILKKTGSYGQSNKLVTFENLGEFRVDEDDDDNDNDNSINNSDNDSYSDDLIDFADSYYSIGHDDVPKDAFHDAETHSEVLSDIYPAEAPLQIRKPRAGNIRETPEFSDFARPKMLFAGDNASIGSFSPDTPPTKQFSSTATNDADCDDEEESKLRRSVILDRLNIVTLGIQAHAEKGDDTVQEPTFGGSLRLHVPLDEESDESMYERFYSSSLKGHAPTKDGPHAYEENEGLDDQCSRKSLLVEEVSTPLTSVNSLNCVSSPKAPVPVIEKKRKRPVHDMFMPILGQLDELTEKLAELEHIL